MEEKEIEYVWLERHSLHRLSDHGQWWICCDRVIGLDCSGFAVLLRLVAASPDRDLAKV